MLNEPRSEKPLFLRRNFTSQHPNQLWQPEPLQIADDSALQEIPLLGCVTAGQPIEICEQQEQIRVPQVLVKKQTYALKVRGNSMIDANIHDGDIIVIEQCHSVDNGETCVVMINNQSVTLKRLYIDREGVRLDPANSQMTPITLKNEDVQVLGIVMGLKRGDSLQ